MIVAEATGTQIPQMVFTQKILLVKIPFGAVGSGVDANEEEGAA